MKQLKILDVDDDPFTLKMLDKKLLKNALDLREAMDVTEQNAAQTIQQLEMSVEELQNVISEVRQVIMSQSIDPRKCVEMVLDIVDSC
jgi:hypothetical protein